MDELDRLFQRLVRAVRDAQPENLSRSIEVGELLDLVPYRAVRSDIGVETNDDYAHAVTRLLAGERGYVFVDDLMQDDLKAELATPNPNLTAYRSYVNARVTLSQEHVRKDLESIGPGTGVPSDTLAASGPAAAAAPVSPATAAPRARTPEPVTGARAPEPPSGARTPTAAPPVVRPQESGPFVPRREAPSSPRAPRTVSSPRPLDLDAVAHQRAARPGCRYCGQALPEGREARFCPACGQNLLVRRCAACSAELEPAWKFCVACGRAATA